MGEYLELYICSECLKTMADAGSINVKRAVKAAPTITKHPWVMRPINEEDD